MLILKIILVMRDSKMKREHVIFLILVLLGLVLRLLFLDKPAGFWHNEMVMYNQTIAGNINDIIEASVQADVHFPLYQILLAGWIKLFGNGDIVIRLFSVLAGVLNVIAAYFAGKELKDSKTGNIFAFLTAINATLIFYSQEVKFYIFLALFVTLSLYFLAAIIKRNKVWAYIGYVISNLLIIYTFTIGILYVIAQGIVFLAYLIIKRRNVLKNFLIANAALVLLILPFVIFILTHMNKYEGAAWIFTSNIFTVFVLIQNFFTPCLIAVYNNPKVYIPTLGLMQLFFIYIPVLIAFWGMYKAVKTDKINYVILGIPALFLLFETILCMNSGLRMLTRYTILAVPPFLLLVSLGLSEIKRKFLWVIVGYLFVINIFYLIFSPQSAVRGYRDLGEKPAAMIMVNNKISSNDTIVLALRKNDFDKYLDFGGRKFSLLQDFVHESYAMKPNLTNKYDAYRDYVSDFHRVNPDFEKDFVKRVIEPMKSSDRVFYIWDENYNTFPVKSNEEYLKIPVMTSSLSKMNAEAFYICNKYLKIQSGYKLKYYRIFIFEK